MDGVLTDISGLMTDRFYTYLTGYNKDTVVCCFKLGASIENTIPKQLLKFLEEVLMKILILQITLFSLELI
jgi:hypothetical protein